MITYTGTLQTSMQLLGSIFIHMDPEGYPDQGPTNEFLTAHKGKRVKITIEVLE